MIIPDGKSGFKKLEACCYFVGFSCGDTSISRESINRLGGLDDPSNTECDPELNCIVNDVLKMDKNGNGRVDFEEYYNAVMQNGFFWSDCIL